MTIHSSKILPTGSNFMRNAATKLSSKKFHADFFPSYDLATSPLRERFIPFVCTFRRSWFDVDIKLAIQAVQSETKSRARILHLGEPPSVELFLCTSVFHSQAVCHHILVGDHQAVGPVRGASCLKTRFQMGLSRTWITQKQPWMWLVSD